MFVLDEIMMPIKIPYKRCKCRVKRVSDGQVEQLHTQVDLVGAAPDSHEPRIGYALYPYDNALMLPRHILLAIRRPSNDFIAPVRVYSFHHLGKHVEDNFSHMPIMNFDGQEV